MQIRVVGDRLVFRSELSGGTHYAFNEKENFETWGLSLAEAVQLLGPHHDLVKELRRNTAEALARQIEHHEAEARRLRELLRP